MLTCTPAFCPGIAGPWKCAAVTVPCRPVQDTFHDSMFVDRSSVALAVPVAVEDVGGTTCPATHPPGVVTNIWAADEAARTRSETRTLDAEFMRHPPGVLGDAGGRSRATPCPTVKAQDRASPGSVKTRAAPLSSR
jgi:hypothetical protein